MDALDPRPVAGALAITPALTTAPEADAAGRSGARPDLGASALLVVDDDETIRTVTAEMLRAGGFAVIEAATGAEALELAAQGPAAIVLDVQLPDLDGFEVGRRLKADPRTASIPVLHLSGKFRDPKDRVRGLETGADAYLTRPVDHDELLATVRALLRLRRAEAGLRESESRRRVAEGLAEIGRALAQSLDPAEVGQRIADTVRALLQGRASTLYRLDPESGDLVAVASCGDVGPTDGQPVVMPRGAGVSGQAVRTRAPAVTPDILADSAVTLPPEVRVRVERAGFRAALAVPLLIQDRVIGVLTVGDRAGRVFEPDAIRLAEAFAAQSALAFEKARLYAETQERLRETQTLLAIARVLSLNLPAEEALRQVARGVAQALQADMVGAYFLDGGKEAALRPIAGYHVPKELLPRFLETRVPVAAYASLREAWTTLRPVWSGDGANDPRWFARELLAGSPPHSVLFAPTPVRGEVVGGLFVVWGRTGREFAPAELRLIAGVASQVGLALENADLARRTQDKLRETEALLDIARVLSSTLELDEVLQMVAQRTARVVGAERCAISLWRDGRLVPVMLRAADGPPDPELWARYLATGPADLETSAVHAEVIRTRQPLAVDDVRAHPGFPVGWAEAAGVRAALIVPLVHQDRVTGTIVLDRTDGPHAWGESEIHVATSIAAQAALAVENSRLYERAGERAEKQRALVTLTGLITSASDSAEVFHAVARAATSLLGAGLARVWVDDPGRRVLRVRGSFGLDPRRERSLTDHASLAYGAGVVGVVFASRTPVYLEDVADDPRLLNRRLVAEAGLHGYAGLPLVFEGRAVGVLSLLFAERRPFSEEEAELARLLADHAAMAIRNARLYEEVRTTRDFLQSIAENSVLTIVTTDVHGRITYMSPGGEEMFGYRAADVARTHVADYYRGGAAEAHEVMRRLRTDGRIGNHETAMRARDGRWIETNAALSLLRDVNGVVVGTLGVIKDVTEHKRAEAGLRASEARFRALIEHSSDAIALTDAGGVVLYASPSTTQILGFQPDELVGRRASDLVHPEDGAVLRGRVDDLLDTPALAVESGEFRVRHRDGSWRWIEAVGSKLLAEPSIGALVFNYRDVSERRTLEEHLRQSQKMDAVGRLAGGVAHDFNNILTVILGRSELLLQRLPADSPFARDVQLIGKTGERAMALTRQLLAFSRRQMLQPRVLDLDAAVSDMEQMLYRLIGEHIELVTVAGSGGGRVKVDPGQLEQVLLNLAVNARDAMPQGGRLTIETASVEADLSPLHRPAGLPPGRYLRLTVTDTGVGMDAKTQSRVFEPFFTTKELGKGTGLGLATVYGIVTQSGGHIALVSAPGRGTRFEIYFPRVEEPVTREESRRAPRRAPIGSETILLVEDDERLRELVHEILRMHGYQMLVAAHPHEAARISDDHAGPIHLLLTDVVMPQMSGRELADRLGPRQPEMRVLYMSGYTDDAIIHHGVLEAEVALLQKPFTAASLARKVREVLDGPENGGGPPDGAGAIRPSLAQ